MNSTSAIGDKKGNRLGRYACMRAQSFAIDDFHIEPVAADHIEAIRNWRNSQMDVLRQSAPLSREQQIKYYSTQIWPDQLVKEPKNILMAYYKGSRHIGYGGLVHIRWDYQRTEMSYLIDPALDRDEDGERHLFLTWIAFMKRLAFDELGLKRIHTETYATRNQHIQWLEEAGFVEEGRMRDHVTVNGAPTDALLHGLLARDEEAQCE